MGEPRISQRGLLAVGVIALIAAGGGVFWWVLPGLQQAGRNEALIGAARVGDVKALEAALNGGGDPNLRDSDGITPLMHAARGDRPDIANPAPSDHPEVVEFLIKRGADPNAKTDSGFVALFWAARYGHESVAKVLIDHKADVNAKDKDGMSALKWATTNNQAKVVELLKEAGATE
jgi:ankyrin repeat protein